MVFSQAEPGTSAKGHLADGAFCTYKYQLAAQVDRQLDRCFHPMHTCLLRATNRAEGLGNRLSTLEIRMRLAYV